MYGLGTALAGSDYTATYESLQFPMGSANGLMRCLTVTITDDTLFEEDETFTVALTVTTSGVSVGNAMTTVTITDDEGMIAVTIEHGLSKNIIIYIAVFFCSQNSLYVFQCERPLTVIPL